MEKTGFVVIIHAGRRQRDKLCPTEFCPAR
jgi:hypothetical protein